MEEIIKTILGDENTQNEKIFNRVLSKLTNSEKIKETFNQFCNHC